MNIGDKYLCEEGFINLFGIPLFEKGEIYEVLDFDDTEVTLNHNLIANEYMSYPKSILEKFTFMNIFKEENVIVVKTMIKKYPNDEDLGRKVRDLFRTDKFVTKMPNDRELGSEIRKIFLKFEK
jgi:hypothetical protein